MACNRTKRRVVALGRDYQKPRNVFTPLIPTYTFDRFVVGSCNQFAHAAAMAVAANQAENYNPLFIYGGNGMGKSHLLNAIGHAIHKNSPDKKVCYCTAEMFMAELVYHLKLRKMDQFRNHFRSVDVLLFDDIQFLSGKTGTSEEFFHTFNALHGANKQIVIASDRSPQDIADIEKGLRSRLEWGLITQIHSSDLEARIAILHNISETKEMQVPDDVIQYIASEKNGDVRILEGMLVTLKACSNFLNIPITLDMAKKNLGNIVVDETDCACRRGEYCIGSQKVEATECVANVRYSRPWICSN